MISVVVPALNEEKHIRACLESIRNQDFTGSYEVVVVDNGSQDNTAGVAREMGARVVPCSRRGVSHARQAGAEAAKGEIVVQADADTTYPRWWLSRIAKQFASHPDAVAVAGTFIYRKPPWWAFFEYSARVFWNILAVIFLRRPYIISGANFAFYKKALMAIGGYNQNAYSSDQFDISSRLSKAGKIYYDRKSWCATSERSVNKPTLVIIYEFLRHLVRFAQQALASLGRLFRKQSPKTKSAKKKKVVKIGFPIVLILIIISCYAYFLPASPVFGKAYFETITPDKVITLTFNTGLNDPSSEKVGE